MDITQTFLSGVEDCQEFGEASDIIKRNSTGKIWLIWGFVYRTIAHQLYGSSRPQIDLDFIVEKPIEMFDLSGGWRKEINRFGNPKLVNGEKHIDYVLLENIYSILHRKLEPSIENFLSGAPLTIQSIAYDVYAKKIIGEIGIKALKNKVIEINDLYFAEYAAQKKEKSLRKMIQEKAEELGFSPIFPK